MRPVHNSGHEWSAGAHIFLLCAVGLAATFAVNGTPVADQWQNSAWSFPLIPSINAEHKVGQAVFPFFGVTLPGLEPGLKAFVAKALSHYTTQPAWYKSAKNNQKSSTPRAIQRPTFSATVDKNWKTVFAHEQRKLTHAWDDRGTLITDLSLKHKIFRFRSQGTWLSNVAAWHNLEHLCMTHRYVDGTYRSLCSIFPQRVPSGETWFWVNNCKRMDKVVFKQIQSEGLKSYPARFW